MIGQTILHYTILEKLGEGGMGVVYRAHDLNLDRDVALKFLPHHLLDDTEEEARLLQEAKAVALLNHPHICGVHALGDFQGRRFIDMEFIDGETLGGKIRRAPLSPADAIAYAMQIGEALQEAHSKGIIHRDVKSDNVMVNSRNQVKVTDFGLAKLKGSLKLASSTSTVGTVAYMSPEQIRGEEADPRSDVFSLGVVVFEMLSGQRPFRGEHEAALMYSIVNEEPQPLEALRPGIPVELSAIVERALKKDPAQRYQAATEMVSDLRSAQESPAAPVRPRKRGLSRQTMSVGKRFLMRPLVLAGVAALLILVAGYFLATRPPEGINAIAVLPFANVTGDSASEYLTDGFTESVINSLSVLEGVKIMSRSSVFRFKGKDVSPEAAAGELGVNAVLTGRLLQRDQRLSVSVELMDVRDQSHIWGDQYERHLNGMQEIQRDIVQQVARRLRLSFTEEQESELTGESIEDPEAYQLYLQGRFFLNKRTAEGFRRAMGFFRQAIEQAPRYAPAYAGLATTYLLEASYNFRRPRESAVLAKAAAEEALQIDLHSAEAHTALATLPGFDWTEYGRHYLRALALNPNYDLAHHWYGYYLLQIGRLDDAMVHFQKARELDPLAPSNYSSLALAFMTLQQHTEALAQLRTALDIDPEFPRAHSLLSHLHLRMGETDLAVQEADRAVLYSDSSVEYIARRGLILGAIGKKREADLIARRLAARSKTEYIPFSVLALPSIGLGRKDEAFRLLELARDELETAINDINIDPFFDLLRDDPRFGRLKQSVGLTSDL